MIEGLQFLEVMMMILLAVVGSLVIWLHLRLTALSQTLKQEKALAKNLDTSLEKAAMGIKSLSEAAQNTAPSLEMHVKKAQNILQDFDYVMDRAEKILQQMDDHSQLSLPQNTDNSNRKSAFLDKDKQENNIASEFSEKEFSEKDEETTKRVMQHSERSVLWGKDLEQVLTQKQKGIQKERKDDVRATFMKAMAEREKRIEENDVTPKSKQKNAAKETLDFLEGMQKTAPRGYGAHAYALDDMAEIETNQPASLDTQDMDALRHILETHP